MITRGGLKHDYGTRFNRINESSTTQNAMDHLDRQQTPHHRSHETIQRPEGLRDQVCQEEAQSVTEDVWDELRRQTERLEQLHTKLEAVKTWKEGIFFKMPFIGKGHISRQDLDRLEKILEGAAQ